MKLYAKENILNTVSAMKTSGRFTHGLLITGEEGSGRRTSAIYTAQALMCEDPDEKGLPCGACRSCRRIENGTHPDVIFAEAGSGKSGGYNVDRIRDYVSDMTVKPNDGDCKVYIFPNGEKLNMYCQNTLLKIIEEPYPYLYIILTALDKTALLPTVLSRIVTLSVHCGTESECVTALSEIIDFSQDEVEEAAEHFGGNIGKCIDYLQKGGSYDLYRTADSAAAAILASDRYTLLKELSMCGNRENFAAVLELIDRLIRDSVALRADSTAELTGFSKEKAKVLSSRLSWTKACRIHEKLAEAREMCGSALNMNYSAVACLAADALSKI